MSNFSRDTFDINKLKHYVGVRLQQGVPLVDADWNESEDIRRFELQAFLKWFVGNGVPKGNDGFRIQPAAESENENDFIIKGGNNTAMGAGRCLVEGWDVMINSNLNYMEQRLYNDDELAATWGVAPLNALTIPEEDRSDLVYLDVWEREVDAEEDPQLINEAIGIETCVRKRREWVVRVAEGETTPPDAPPAHFFYPLASLMRLAGQAQILEEHITDLRLTGLSILSHHDIQQMAKDAFGVSYTLDHDAQPNLKVNLKDAINALLRGNLPGTPDLLLTEEVTFDYNPVALEDREGDIWVFWDSTRTGNGDIWYKRYRMVNGAWTTTGDTRLPKDDASEDDASDTNPFVIEDRNGDIWVFWQSYRDGNNNIYCRRHDHTSGWEVDDYCLTEDEAADTNPFVIKDRNGDIWVFWQSNRDVDPTTGIENFNIYCRRHDHNLGWEENDRLTVDTASDTDPFVIEDRNGDIWVFWQSNRGGNNNIYYRCYHRSAETPGWEAEDHPLTEDAASDSHPFALVDGEGNILVFWQSNRDGNNNIYYRHYNGYSWSADIRLTEDTASDDYPSALVDSRGDIWLFWSTSRYGKLNIYYKRYVNSGGWTHEMALTEIKRITSAWSPFAFEDSRQDIWLFWNEWVSFFYPIWGISTPISTPPPISPISTPISGPTVTPISAPISTTPIPIAGPTVTPPPTPPSSPISGPTVTPPPTPPSSPISTPISIPLWANIWYKKLIPSI